MLEIHEKESVNAVRNEYACDGIRNEPEPLKTSGAKLYDVCMTEIEVTQMEERRSGNNPYRYWN